MSRFEPDVASESEQRQFERAVLAVMYRVSVTGERIDQAAHAHVSKCFFGLQRDHLLADMIICAADCLRSLGRHQGSERPGAESVLNLLVRWQGRSGGTQSWPGDGRTRIQDCIRNLRLAEAGGDIGNP